MSSIPLDDDNNKKEKEEDKKISNEDKIIIPKKDKRYFRVWRLEASKEFIIFMCIIIFAIATAMYNPIEIRKVGQQLVDLAQLNNNTNIQNLNNTNKIINYLDYSNKNDTAKGIDIIKVLFLYMQDEQRDMAKVMEKLGVPNSHFVKVNSTHVMTEIGTAKLPYPINMTGFQPELNQNRTAEELESIKH